MVNPCSMNYGAEEMAWWITMNLYLSAVKVPSVSGGSPKPLDEMQPHTCSDPPIHSASLKMLYIDYAIIILIHRIKLDITEQVARWFICKERSSPAWLMQCLWPDVHFQILIWLDILRSGFWWNTVHVQLESSWNTLSCTGLRNKDVGGIGKFDWLWWRKML